VNEKACAVMFEFKKYWKPDITVHYGDNFDFRHLRRNASEQEVRDDPESDYEVGLEFLRQLKPNYFLRGNHDERLWDLLQSDDGKLKQLAKKLIGEIHATLKGAMVLPYHKRKGVLQIGKMRFIHGYTSGVSATKRAAEVYGAVMMGHTHTVDAYVIPRLDREVARTCGCLCNLDMDYNRAQIQTLRQEHGFAYGILLEDGTYHAYQAMPVNGRWYFPTEMKEIKA
jgi:hypothetical protein